MQIKALTKSVGFLVQLEPIACSLDGYGRELPQQNDFWLVASVGEDGVAIRNLRTDHTLLIGLDSVHHFHSNPAKSIGGRKCGFYVLTVQIFLHGRDFWIRPTRPGERVAPPPVNIEELDVGLRFPADSGLQARLLDAGYRIAWCRPHRVAQLAQREGWEEVIEQDQRGRLVKYRSADPSRQVLIKKPIEMG